MARRNLTQLDLRMEDLQEYEMVKKCHENSKKFGGAEHLPDNSGLAANKSEESTSPCFAKMTKEMIQDRIGYDPGPRQQPFW